MVIGWRRAFCTSVPKDHEPCFETDDDHTQQTQHPAPTPLSNATGSSSSPRFLSRFFSSSPGPSGGSTSTPPVPDNPQASPCPTLRCRTTPATAPSTPAGGSPRLRCNTGTSARFFQRGSTPSSPLSLLKTALRLTRKTRCGVCGHSIKTAQGAAIFTAECNHSFHFPCLASSIGKNGGLACPVCGSRWKEVPLVTLNRRPKPPQQTQSGPQLRDDREKFSFKGSAASSDPKVYNDDEPLTSSASGTGRFNPIPESDENEEEEGGGPGEFQGFFPANCQSAQRRRLRNESSTSTSTHRDIEARILADAAVVAVGRSHETYAAVMKIKAPSASSARRASVDLVAVLDVGGSVSASKLQLTKRAMKLVISSLSPADRLAIVVSSSCSKRLLPLRLMSPAGRRSARRLVDSLFCGHGSSVGDALRKAAKVLEDRRERNPACSVFLFTGGGDERGSGDVRRRGPLVSSTRYSDMDIPVHSVSLAALSHEPAEEAFANRIGGLLTVVALDVRLKISFAAGSCPGQVSSAYSCTGRPGVLIPGLAKLGDLYADEEREILLEVKVPPPGVGSHHVVTVRSLFKGPLDQELIYGQERALAVPRPHSIRSSDPVIRRLRVLFMMIKAVAESRRLVERNDLGGAQQLLSSARASLRQSESGVGAEEWIRGLEAEMAEVNWRRQNGVSVGQQVGRGREAGLSVREDEKEEAVTPTSPWKAAERLAKVAIIRKSMNRVSDLHGLEDARF